MVLLMLETVYLSIACTIGICSILAVIIQINKSMFYSKVEGCILSTKIDAILLSINEIKDKIK